MAKCTRCGKKGIFLKLTNGLCDNCALEVWKEKERASMEAQYAQQRVEQQAQLEKERADMQLQMKKEQAALQTQLDAMAAELSDQKALFAQISAEAYAEGTSRAEAENEKLKAQSLQLQSCVDTTKKNLLELLTKEENYRRSVANAEQKVRRSKELVKAIQHASEDFGIEEEDKNVERLLRTADELMSPTVSLPLQCLGMKDLRKRYKENEKNIQATFEKYKDRYTTKANIAIYRLMVIALSAELQNVLHNIVFGKLDDALSNIKALTNKYYVIAADGNQSIAPTVKKFVGELDYYFQEAVKIEYEYYVQRERAKEEQRAIREQMRQEAEERRELERQQKQIEKEESKFHDQISQLSQQIEVSADDEKTALLKARIEELQKQLAAVADQKDKIVELQNGKAGNVYVISNIGSFGENVFKIGMTRRLEPMERVNELGSASVPFPFDVHSMIFSDDAVGLETKLHHLLNDQRVNKVNLRKEFFRISLDDLEKLVGEIAPTAEFKRTVLAEQYRQSLSISHVSDEAEEAVSDDDEEEELAE